MAADYDQTVLGTASVPYEALRQTRPIVIVDEPHRFRRENRAYQAVIDELQPLAIFRFGATFPKLDKSGKTDYNNLVFNLGAVEAFNEQLVKGVAIQYPQDTTDETTRLKLTSLSPRQAQAGDLPEPGHGQAPDPRPRRVAIRCRRSLRRHHDRVHWQDGQPCDQIRRDAVERPSVGDRRHPRCTGLLGHLPEPDDAASAGEPLRGGVGELQARDQGEDADAVLHRLGRVVSRRRRERASAHALRGAPHREAEG